MQISEWSPSAAIDHAAFFASILRFQAILPGFESYSVGVDVSSDDEANSQVTRETVAHVVTDDSLDERSRETAERLIRLNVPQLDRVEFTSQTE